MRNDIGANWWWIRSHLIGNAGMITILIILTLLIDGNNPGDGIVRVYNEIYIMVLPIYALVIPLSIRPILRVNLQFGANRKELFYATEIASGIVLVACAMMVVGMNMFSREIYGVVDAGVWEISTRKWIFYFLGSKLLWVSSQSATYAWNEVVSKFRMFKWGVIGMLYILSIIVTLVMMRMTLEISPTPSTNVVRGVSVAAFVMICIVIALVQRSNYRVFMKMEV